MGRINVWDKEREVTKTSICRRNGPRVCEVIVPSIVECMVCYQKGGGGGI